MLSDKSITNIQLHELESSLHNQEIIQRNEDYNYSSQNYSTPRRYDGHKRPPFDPLDINGNEMNPMGRENYSYPFEDDRFRDSYRSKHYSKSRYYGDEGKENSPYRGDSRYEDFYNDPYSSNRKGYRYREDDYMYYDRDDPRRRRRRSFELRESRYSPRDRSLSPDQRLRNYYRGSSTIILLSN